MKFVLKKSIKYMLPPCHFFLYSFNTIVTLTEETNRSGQSDTKKLDHFIICILMMEFYFFIVYFLKRSTAHYEGHEPMLHETVLVLLVFTLILQP